MNLKGLFPIVNPVDMIQLIEGMGFPARGPLNGPFVKEQRRNIHAARFGQFYPVAYSCKIAVEIKLVGRIFCSYIDEIVPSVRTNH